jgi:syntaxin 1B/2/3
MFTDLATIVNIQDDLINQVAYQVGSVEQYMGMANDELDKAIVSAVRARRRKWCLAGTCTVLMIVIIVILVLVVGPKIRSMTQ